MQSCKELAISTNQKLQTLLRDLKRITLNAIIAGESMTNQGEVVKVMAQRLKHEVEKIENEIETFYLQFQNGDFDAAEQMLSELEKINIWITDVCLNFAIVAKKESKEVAIKRVMEISVELRDLIERANIEIAKIREELRHLRDLQ